MGETKKVVVVGAGAGGMALAGRLKKARPEWDVELLEKNKKLGGRMASEGKGGFRFDTGPSLLLAPDIYREAFHGFLTTNTLVSWKLVSI